MRRCLVTGGDRGRRLTALTCTWLSFCKAHIIAGSSLERSGSEVSLTGLCFAGSFYFAQLLGGEKRDL